jgi:hypothetical protein
MHFAKVRSKKGYLVCCLDLLAIVAQISRLATRHLSYALRKLPYLIFVSERRVHFRNYGPPLTALVVLFQAFVAPFSTALAALVAASLVPCHAFEAPCSMFCAGVLVSGAAFSLALLDWLHPAASNKDKTVKNDSSIFFTTILIAVKVPCGKIAR